VSNDPYKNTRDGLGSTEGGLRLYIIGENFSPFDSVVFVGWKECKRGGGFLPIFFN